MRRTPEGAVLLDLTRRDPSTECLPSLSVCSRLLVFVCACSSEPAALRRCPVPTLFGRCIVSCLYRLPFVRVCSYLFVFVRVCSCLFVFVRVCLRLFVGTRSVAAVSRTYIVWAVYC